MSSNDLILNYHDACIYRSDLAILKSPTAWLNDAVMHFFFTRLSKSLLRSTHSINHSLNFVDPSVLSFFMHQFDLEEDGDEEDVLGLLKNGFHDNQQQQQQQQQQRRHSFFFLPINDNYVSHRWTTPGGGTHWSLLLMIMTMKFPSYEHGHDKATPVQPKVTCYHLDSSPGCNRAAAQAVADKIRRSFDMLYNRTTKSSTKDNATARKNLCPVQECSVPQQQNGYDCGLHTLAAAEALGRAFVPSTMENNNSDSNYYDYDDLSPKSCEEIVKAAVHATTTNTTSFCLELRQRIASDIETLAASYAEASSSS